VGEVLPRQLRDGCRSAVEAPKAFAFQIEPLILPNGYPIPFGTGDPDRPNVASTTFRTVQDLTGGRYYFESTYAPNVAWIDYSKLDFSRGTSEMELPVEKKIFSLDGDVTGQLEKAKPFVFGMNKR
jgi:choloylglycine hydrolase